MTQRSCEACGTNLIPYPLSTGPKCGDPLYNSFYCNISDGQVNFETPSGTYRVTTINLDTRTFFIRIKDIDNCKNISSGNFLQLNLSLPFHMISGCNTNLANFSSELISKDGVEVEIAWMPPLEPICTSPADCQEWPNSSCNATEDGKNRCRCNKKFRWDSMNSKCKLGTVL